VGGWREAGFLRGYLMGGEDIGKNQITAVGNRVYTNNVRRTPTEENKAVSNRPIFHRRVF
ncbi:hypothetical protein, partial [Microcoleus sp. Aus8_D3]|uniref:hypothetical protein n=1 Tax=Microcoleus sp. Aus8_D3 TaxID=2818633 RepID=UPI002FD5F1A9